VPKPAGHDELDVDAVLAGYDGWLTRQPLAARTRAAYLAQVRDFVTWLAGSEHGARALGDPDVREWAIRFAGPVEVGCGGRCYSAPGGALMSVLRGCGSVWTACCRSR